MKDGSVSATYNIHVCLNFVKYFCADWIEKWCVFRVRALLKACFGADLCYTDINSVNEAGMHMAEDRDAGRICRMEQMYDRVRAAHASGADMSALEDSICELTDYLDSGQWLRDYERDERGGWPQGLKRGVLSQDGLYNLLTEIEEKQKQT